MASSIDIDELVQSIVKTPDEIALENKHGWIKQPTPAVCHQNCFNKTYALTARNWKNIFPEYYWLEQRKKSIEHQIRQLSLNTNDEQALEALNAKLDNVKQQLSLVASPHHVEKQK